MVKLMDLVKGIPKDLSMAIMKGYAMEIMKPMAIPKD
jgi:hypothetical protein